MKYRKKPVVIEAYLLGREDSDWPSWLTGWTCGDQGIIGPHLDGHILIPTLEGLMRADEGDYIICGIKGEVYPCRADIFDMTYEKMEE